MHVARKAGLAIVATAAVLLLAQAATAQVPPATPGGRAAVTVSVPPGPTTVALGGSTSLDVTVGITISNIVCQGAGTATVSLAARDVPSSMTGIAAQIPSTVVFSLTGPQAYTDAGNGAFTGSQVKKLNITVAANTIANHDHSFNVTATFSASGLSSACTPVPGGSLDAAGSALTAIKTGPALTGSGTGGNSTSGSGTNTSTSKASFSLPLAIQVAALLGIGMFVSRRQD